MKQMLNQIVQKKNNYHIFKTFYLIKVFVYFKKWIKFGIIVYSFSSIIQNIYSTFSSSNYSSICYYFYFDSSELFISYPLIYDYEREFLEVMLNYEDNPKWCTDKNGNIYKTYKAKCRDYYVNSQKAKTTLFDNNSKDNKNRTIFVTDFYQDLRQPKSANIYTMCIQFKDPISGQNAYAC